MQIGANAILPDIFQDSVASDNSICPASTHPLKNEYQDILRVKTVGV
jgi:hypothetical protein